MVQKEPALFVAENASGYGVTSAGDGVACFLWPTL